MSASMINLLITALGETLLMVITSALIASLFGILLGVTLHITRQGQMMANPKLHSLLGIMVNTGRSVPFIILLVAIIPVTRFLVGTSIGTIAAIVPLSIGAIPFMARLIEAALMEIPSGLLDAANSMGCHRLQIITKVLLPEALPGILNSITITMVTLVDYSAMAGAIGGGGLGDIGIRYGYQRFDLKIMLVTIFILVVLVQIIQNGGHYFCKKVDHR